MNKGVLLTREEILRIAKHLYFLPTWIEMFGKPIYHLKTDFTVKKILKTKHLEEWDIYQHGHHWYVFLSNEKRGVSSKESGIKLTPKDIELIHNTDFSIKGTQRSLAKQLNCSESHLSRIRRNIRRLSDSSPKILNKKEKNNLFLSRKDVIAFFGMMFTVKEFIEEIGDEYGVMTSWDVSNMCANQRNKKLPTGWQAVRVGESWLLYKVY